MTDQQEAAARDHLKPGPDIDHWRISGNSLTLGDLRRAAQVYASIGEGAKNA